MNGTRFDTIIVGGGSAGCVLANRLSARSARSVLLIEAGNDTPPGHEPADVLDTFASSYYNKAYMWPGLKCHWRTRATSPATAYDQARIMGGGSSVMGMVALRGTPDDYDEWVALGAAGWGWDDVLPYFNKLEHDLDFDGALHGRSGPVPIRRTPPAQWAPLSRAVHQYALERQMPHVADMNGDFRDGYGSLPMSNTLERRASAAICYLDAVVRARPNLTIRSPATVTGLVFDGKRAVGVSTLTDGRPQEFRGTDIILCAGALHSPVLLMRAGIGAAEDLRGARNRGDRRPARGRPQSAEPRPPVCGGLSAARRAPVAGGAAAPDDVLSLFIGIRDRARERHVYGGPQQILLERARRTARQFQRHPVQAALARPCHARLRRSGLAVLRRVQLRRRPARPAAPDGRLPPDRRAGVVRADQEPLHHDLPGPLHRPHPPPQPAHARQCGADIGHRRLCSTPCRD